MEISSGIRNAHILGKRMLGELSEYHGNPDTWCGTVGNGDRLQMKTSTNHACHAGLKYMGTEYQASKVVDLILPTKLTEDEALAWYSFILERSVYAPIFAERRAKASMKRGYFIFHADINANLMVAGAVALRMASEKHEIPVNFCRLVEAGADEDVAYIAAHCLNSAFGTLSVQGGYQGHVAIAPFYMGVEQLRCYFKSDVKDFGTYAVKKSYNGINHMFGEREVGINFPLVLKKRYASAINGIARDKRIAIFNLAWNNIKRASSIKVEEGYPILAKILNEYKQEILHEA